MWQKNIGAYDFHWLMRHKVISGLGKRDVSARVKPGQGVVMDNASFHKSPLIKEAIELAGCKLVYLPPYSPDLNPIEKFWANLKRWINQHLPFMEDLYNPNYG